MNSKTIISYGWEEIKSDKGAVAYKNPTNNNVILALNETPIKNYIPLITPNKKHWKISLVNPEKEEVICEEDYSSQTGALQDLQDYLQENQVNN